MAREESGRVVFVQYALPGELVEAVPAGRRGGAAFARTVQVLEGSPERVAARCPHFGACGGCHWQHAAYDAQLRIKRRAVEDVWRRAGLRLPPDAPVMGMDDPWRYRIRGEFEAIHGGPRFQFGFHRSRSHSLLPISTCPIHDLRIERGLEAFRTALDEHRVPTLQNLLLTVEPNGGGLLWNARHRGGAGTGLPDGVIARAAELLPDLVMLDDSLSIDFWGLTFRVRSDSFVQTNYRQMLVLYQVALEMLDPRPAEHVLDLYAGMGTISLPIARSASRVTAVEENPRAVRLGRLAARINGIASVGFVVGRVEQALRQLRAGDQDSALLDPPRAGCEPAALAELLRLAPPRIVYVSCEPSTHARDIAGLIAGGYRLRRVALVDMFPQTYHVESVALLER